MSALPKLLVSCCNLRAERPGLYVVDALTGEARVLTSGGMRGLVRCGDCYLSVDHDHLYHVDVGAGRVSDIGKIRDLDAAHSLFIHGGRLWINNTGRNTLLVLELATWREALTLSPRGTQGGDHNHINSIWIEGDCLYLSMMAWDRERAGAHWLGGDGAVAKFDLDGRHIQTMFRGLTQPHTVRIIDGRLHWLESITGKLYRDGEVVLDVGGYARGLAADEGFYYIGTSLNRHTGGSRTGVWVIARRDHTNRRFVALPASEGVYDIEVLEG